MAKRLTQRLVRELALALPEAHEHQHRGRPDLRVRNTIFATLPEDGRTVNVKTTSTDLDLLVSTAPDTYRDVWGGRWVGVDLGRVTRGRLRTLLVTAWALAAPRRLRDAHAHIVESARYPAYPTRQPRRLRWFPSWRSGCRFCSRRCSSSSPAPSFTWY